MNEKHQPCGKQGPSLPRTVCKIAARILFVLLLVGVAVAVMV